MKSYQLFRAFGIDVKVHPTFLWLLGIFALMGSMDGGGVIGAIGQAVWILCIFGIVLLHEFGHSLAALHFKIPVLDITLMPLGGMARMAYMPRNPRQELIIAIAGPAVNVVLAALALLLPIPLEHNYFFIVNVALLVFNLVPAFPMDGGRVLRALLATKMDYIEATRKAVKVSKYACIGLFIYGFSGGNYMVCLISIFIYFAGKAELFSVEAQNLERRFYESSPMWKAWQEAQATNAAGHPSGPVESDEELPPHDYQGRVEELKKSGEKVQVIYSDGKVLGVLRQKD
jgi:Zn-dependent protease